MPIYMQIIIVITYVFTLLLVVYNLKLFLKMPEALEVPDKRQEGKGMRMKAMTFIGYVLMFTFFLFFLIVLGKALWQYVIH